MRNDVGAFESWLNAYRQAWENRDPEAAAAFFTESGTYQVTPFLEPICGRKAIFEYWSEVARTEENAIFRRNGRRGVLRSGARTNRMLKPSCKTALWAIFP
jgi:hypothetical protein